MDFAIGTEEEIIFDLKSKFSAGGVILFLGRDCDEELTEEILNQKWSCIFTTNTSPDLTTKFAKLPGDHEPGREVCDVTTLEQLKGYEYSDLLSSSKLKIIRLSGVDMEAPNQENSPRALIKMRNDMLKVIPQVIKRSFNHLVILGYQYTKAGQELDLYDICTELPAGSITAFGVPEESETETLFHDLRDAARRPTVYSQRLSCILKTVDQFSIDSEAEPITPYRRSDHTIFACKKPVQMPLSVTVKCRAFASVLTDAEVNTGRIYGKETLREKFYDFLKESVSAPQWFGYQPYHDFHVARFFEEPLYRQVDVSLSQASSDGVPIIAVSGPPSSGKSVTLAAVAYHIFQDKKYPVVYMTSSNLWFSGRSDNFDSLNLMMRDLERLGIDAHVGIAERPVLLVWDGSFPNLERVQSLVKLLAGAGRKAVLLCSLYEQTEAFYNYYKEKIENTLYYSAVSNLWIIKSSRELTDGEKWELRKLYKEYADFEPADSGWKGFREENLFLWLYYRMQGMQMPLSVQLKTEMDAIFNSGDLPLYIKTVEKTAMEIAFEQAGFVMPDTVKQKTLNWSELTDCVALFSQFGLDTPVSLALYVLCTPAEAEVSAAARHHSLDIDYSLVHEILSRLPWLRYVPLDDSEIYVLKFREHPEATIYLKNHSTNAEKQIEIILKIMNYLRISFNEEGAEDTRTINALNRLLQCIGPNSQVPNFSNHDYWEQYPKIIEGLHLLRCPPQEEDGLFNSSLILQEVSYIREYYGKESKLDLDTRMKYLQYAMNLSAEAHTRLKGTLTSRTRISWGLGNLLVEQISCHDKMKDLQDTAQKNGEAIGTPQILTDFCFADVWDDLQVSIINEPDNDFFYNAMLRLFINEFELHSTSRRELFYNATQIRQLLIERDSNPSIGNENSSYRDSEFKKLRAGFEEKIRQLNGNKALTIPTLEQQLKGGARDTFIDLFREMTDQENNPSAVLYIAQEALRGINFKEGVPFHRLTTCKDVMNFLTRYNSGEYAGLVSSDPGGSYLLIQLFWAIHTNGNSILPQDALCKTPHLQETDWSALCELCRSYIEKFSDGRAKYNNALLQYLYALCLAELRQYERSIAALSAINKDRIGQAERRWKAYYILSDHLDTGSFVPRIFKGVVSESVETEKSGYIKITNPCAFPNRIGMHDGVRFHRLDLGLENRMPAPKQGFPRLMLGLSFAGFTLYTEEGVKRSEKR